MYIIIDNKKYNVIVMDTFMKRLRGLMFKNEKIKDIYMFPRCNSIHTFYMKQDIDVCILDKNYVITHISRGLSRGKVLIKKGYHTLEMPLGSTRSLSVGDKLCFKKKIKHM